MLKGLAIFWVVMGHVMTMCIRDIDRAFAFKLIGAVHMPLFFFIAGWFTYRVTADGKVAYPRLGQRALQLLVPLLVLPALWVWYWPHSGLQSPLPATMHDLILQPYKGGYWFTLVLFEVIVIYAVSVPILRKIKNVYAQIAFLLISWFVIWLISENLVSANTYDFLSLLFVYRFWPIFLFGAICASHRDWFQQLTTRSWIVTLAILLGACSLYFVVYYWEFNPIYQSILAELGSLVTLHVCLVIMAVAVVRPWSEKAFAADAKPLTRHAAGLWQYLGRKSLAIYLLHYFFLFPLGALVSAMLSMGLGITPCFAVAAFVALAIIAMTLLADAIITKSPLLALLFTGQVPGYLKKHNK